MQIQYLVKQLRNAQRSVYVSGGLDFFLVMVPCTHPLKDQLCLAPCVSFPPFFLPALPILIHLLYLSHSLTRGWETKAVRGRWQRQSERQTQSPIAFFKPVKALQAKKSESIKQCTSKKRGVNCKTVQISCILFFYYKLNLENVLGCYKTWIFITIQLQFIYYPSLRTLISRHPTDRCLAFRHKNQELAGQRTGCIHRDCHILL